MESQANKRNRIGNETAFGLGMVFMIDIPGIPEVLSVLAWQQLLG